MKVIITAEVNGGTMHPTAAEVEAALKALLESVGWGNKLLNLHVEEGQLKEPYACPW